MLLLLYHDGRFDFDATIYPIYYGLLRHNLRPCFVAWFVADGFYQPFAGKIYDKFGMKLLFTVGAICLLFGNLGMVFVTMETTLFVTHYL